MVMRVAPSPLFRFQTIVIAPLLAAGDEIWASGGVDADLGVMQKGVGVLNGFLDGWVFTFGDDA